MPRVLRCRRGCQVRNYLDLALGFHALSSSAVDCAGGYVAAGGGALSVSILGTTHPPLLERCLAHLVCCSEPITHTRHKKNCLFSFHFLSLLFFFGCSLLKYSYSLAFLLSLFVLSLSVFFSVFFCFSVSLFVELHVDLTLLHSCTFASLVSRLVVHTLITIQRIRVGSSRATK